MARSPTLRSWLRALAAGTLLFACALLGAIWFGGSETALRWLAAQAVQASAGKLTLEDVRGSLYANIRIARFAFEDGDRRIEGNRLDLAWSPRALLFTRTVQIDSLSLQALSVEPGKPSAEPLQLPTTLQLPLRLEIRKAHIDALAFASDGGKLEFSALTLELQNPHGRLHALASAQTPWGKGDADLTLAQAAPFALNGSAGLKRADAPHAYTVRAEVAGTLADIALTATGNSGGAEAELRAAIAPLQQMPLRQATLHVARVDARKFEAGLPRTDVTVDLSLRAQDQGAYAGELKLVNSLPGSIDASLAPLRAAELAFAGTPGALELKDVRLDFGNAGKLTGAGSLRQGRLNLALETSAFDLRGVYAKLAATRLAGSLKLAANGDTQEVQADLREGEYRVHIDASRRGDTLQVRSAQLAIAGGELNFSGEMSLAKAREFRAAGKLSHFDPSRLGDYPAALINGSISASGHLSPSPEAALEFSTTDSRYRGHRLHGGGKARVSAERIWDSDIALDLGANHLSARGAFGAPGDGLDWRLDGGDLAAFAAQLGGQLRASGKLEGTIAEPSGAFRAQGRNLVWAGEHRVAEFSVDGKIDRGIDGPLALSASLRDYRSKALEIEAASVTGSGRRGEHELKLAVRNETVDAHAALAGGWHTDKGWSGRILSFDNRGRYAVALEAPASLAIKGGDFALGAATLRFAHGNVRITELARRANGIFSAGTLSGLDTRELLALIDPLQENPQEISGALTLGGRWKLAATDTINGEFELQREQGDLTVLSEPETPLGLSRLALAATLTDDRLAATLDAAGAVFGSLSASLRTTLTRQGTSVGLSGNAPLALDATLDVPSLAWVTSLSGGRMTVAGKLKGQFAGQGTVDQPHLSGGISGDGLKFEYPEQGIYLKDGKLRASLKENSLLLDQLTLRGGEGTLEGSGSVEWESGKTSARIALKASKLEVIKRLDRHLILSGDAEAKLQDKQVQLTAKLKADKGEITLPEADTPTLSSDVVVLGRDGEAERKSPPFATDIALDLDLGDNFRLKGRGITARLAGAVKVQANSGAPATASGSIRVAEGSYSAYAQSLTIDRGIFNFAGPLDNPGLDIVALRKGLAVEAGVAIRGTALAPQISLTSNPSVPDSEKLSWLILGHGMEGANRTDLGLLQAAAGALLARGESISLQQRIAHAAGLDEFSLAGGSGLESTVLTLGKRLSSRAYLSFEQGLATATNLVKISYTLTPRLSVRTQTGTENAVDAFYTFSFK
ncbi:MAG: translocation/assembly module TamB domain-containing protein [Burkholderiales bacterium]|nr:translocation/assembly module TamB domain-containing protein [Burkholderiales bacterium]